MPPKKHTPNLIRSQVHRHFPEKLGRKISKPAFIHVIENTRLRAESGGTWIKSQKYEINSPD